jgi:1L-myo-inositol 1-phosphate cytidylyltransferase / CDP-L-myo-inositol myo-inositolphosphotransferase
MRDVDHGVGGGDRPAAPLLVVLPHRLGDRGAAVRRMVLGGLPLLRRTVLAADRAGFMRTLVVAPGESPGVLLEGTTAQVVEPRVPACPLGTAEPDRTELAASLGLPSCRQRVVFLADHVVLQVGWLRALAEMPVEPEHLYADGPLVAVVETADAVALVIEAVRAFTAGEALSALRRLLKTVEGPLRPEGRFVVGTPENGRAAETWLLGGLIKPGEPFMSRVVERRVSLALTRRLARTSITPNGVSLIMVAVGLLGAPFFLSASAAAQLAGALLFLTHSILDGCDGELARLKFLESRGGALLDFWGDNLVHVAVFTCMAVGWTLSAGTGWPLLLGGVTVATTLGAALTLHSDPPRHVHDSAGPTASRLVGALSNRSFIYLIVALAVLGRASWFLIPAAVGTPIFLGLALAARRARRSR